MQWFYLTVHFHNKNQSILFEKNCAQKVDILKELGMDKSVSVDVPISGYV